MEYSGLGSPCVCAVLCRRGTASTSKEVFPTAAQGQTAWLPQAGISAGQSEINATSSKSCFNKNRKSTQRAGGVNTYLSRVERSCILPLHDKHVDEVDEDAGSLAGVTCTKCQPLVENHEDQVSEEAEQEEQLGKKHQIDAESLMEMPERKTKI